MSNALERAIKAAGGLSKLAEKMGVLPQVVNNWRKRGIPAERVLDLSRATDDGKGVAVVTPHQLRPDLYPNEKAAA